MWFTSCYPRSDEISQKSNKLDYILSESVEDKVRTWKTRLEQSLTSAYMLHLYEPY